MTRHPPIRPLLIAVLAFATGWLASTAWLGLAPLRYAATVTGTVTLVNEDGTKLCIQPDKGGGQLCGVVLGPPRPDGPSVGDHLSVVVGWLRVSDALDQEIFVIAAPPIADG